jgi:hypothetical protein
MRLSLRLRGNGINFPAELRGAIAQLAERLDRTQEVGGSNPPSSIDPKSLHVGISASTSRFQPPLNLRSISGTSA